MSLAIPSKGTLSLWIKSYIENGYNVIEKKRGRYGQKESAEDRIRSRITEADTGASEAEYETVMKRPLSSRNLGKTFSSV